MQQLEHPPVEPSEVRALLIAQPFQPFTVYMADGSEYDVTHPERVMLGDETLYVYASGAAARCALINITRIKTAHAATNEQ